jgi:solute:Na+ symporter, SSS family
MSAVLGAMLAYVIVQFAIGFAVSRRISSEADYILAGRSLGTLLVSFSVFASFFGAEAIVASAGAVYEKGLGGALVDPFGYAIALLVVGAVLAGPLWNRGLTTFADLFRERYSPGVEKLVVLMLLPGSLFWAAAQIRAFGQVLSANSTLDLGTAITIAAVLVGAYSIVGGLLADSVTDVIQGLAVIIGLVILTAIVLRAPLAADAARAAVQSATPVPGPREAQGFLRPLEELLIPICGTVVSVELISRFLGSRSARVAVTGTSIGAAMYFAAGIMPVYLGLIGPSLLPGLAEPEQIVPKLAEAYLPGALRIAFVGAIISAILSTVHSALHGPASQVAHNIVLRLYPDLDARQKLWIVRGTVMALSVVAYTLSLSSERIHDLVETASAFGSAGVFVVAIFALFKTYGGTASAYAALLAGMGVWIVAKFAFGFHAPYLLALISSVAIYVALAGLNAPAARTA